MFDLVVLAISNGLDCDDFECVPTKRAKLLIAFVIPKAYRYDHKYLVMPLQLITAQKIAATATKYTRPMNYLQCSKFIELMQFE